VFKDTTYLVCGLFSQGVGCLILNNERFGLRYQ